MPTPNPQSSECPGGHVDLPAPTLWPMVAAFGIALLALGLVTHWVVSLVGLASALVSAIGWWREVLPEEHEERVPWVPESERARPVQPVSNRVQHLRLGQGGHRVRIPAQMHPYSSGLKAGLLGGMVMAVLAVAYGLVAQGSPWFPINLLAAAALPDLARASTEQLRAFSGVGFLVATVLHGIVCLLVGFIYAVMVPMFPRRGWLWAGVVLPLFWSGLFHAAGRFIDPTLVARVDWPWFVVCQVAFGLVTGWSVSRSERIETRQTWPLAARVGLEAEEEES